MKSENLGNIPPDTEQAYLGLLQKYADGMITKEIAEVTTYKRRAINHAFTRLIKKYGASHLPNLTAILMREGKIK